MTVGLRSQKLLLNGLPFQSSGHSPRKIVDQRVAETRAPAQTPRLLGLAGLLLELAVHLGQHQEQRVLLLARSAGVAPIVWSIQADIMSERSRTS